MSFELSFSSEFFILPGELYDGAEYPHGDEPYSVLGAIRAMEPEYWQSMCEDVFECHSDYVTVEMVLEKIQEVDTCTDLRSPVSVWIDEEGWHTVEVYDRGDRPDM